MADRMVRGRTRLPMVSISQNIVNIVTSPTLVLGFRMDIRWQPERSSPSGADCSWSSTAVAALRPEQHPRPPGITPIAKHLSVSSSSTATSSLRTLFPRGRVFPVQSLAAGLVVGAHSGRGQHTAHGALNDILSFFSATGLPTPERWHFAALLPRAATGRPPRDGMRLLRAGGSSR